MDQYFSGEDSVVKTRKPYTISKQRERWTDEEHSRFLEALKLHGRAWQRIEEHIGTKTAVQIRSHAQKFFTKLEKEAPVKGVLTVQALDIEIPPPRPKRKPSNPYPRKKSEGSPTSQVGKRDGKLLTLRPSFQNEQILDWEKEHNHEKTTEEEQTTNGGEIHDNNSSRMVNLLQESCSSVSSTNKSFFRNTCAFKKFVPSKKEAISQGEISESQVPKYGDFKLIFPDDGIGKDPEFQNSNASLEQLDKGKSCLLPTNEMQSTKEEVQGRNIGHSHNQDDYRSFLHMSSTFSNLISCALLQNPTAYAAASFASTLWPYKNAESSVCNNRGVSSMQLNSSPSIAAMVASTVAAATAWWAAHGLLPICAPAVGNPVPSWKTDGEVECFHPEQSDILQADHEKGILVSEFDDLNMGKSRKRIYRSSCGSNSASSSEVEIDETEKIKKPGEESKELEACTLITESGNRRSKSISNSIDPWKEVSQEGRLAFRALFSGGVLPQSFSHPHDSKDDIGFDYMKDDVHLSLTLNGGSYQSDQTLKNNMSLTGNKNDDEGMITIGLGLGKIGHRRTGFKPYKRCSVESTENRVATSNCCGENNGAKRIRSLEKASS